MNSRFLIAAMFALFSSSVVNGQQEAMPKMSEMPKMSQVAQESPIPDQVKSKVTGRLPRNYAAVVNSVQRLEIYRIQADYRSQLELLQKQFDELKRRELSDIEQVLSKDQLMRVRKLRSTSLRRQAKSESAKPEAVKSTANEKDAVL